MARIRGNEEVLQSLWGGYGRLVRRPAQDGGTEIAKDIRWPPGKGDLSHRRKLRSYRVEAAWYRNFAPRLGPGCRVPSLRGLEERPEGMLLVLEDLDAAGFPRRSARPAGADLQACVTWLARLHAAFLGERPEGLWQEGSYWHLATRPEELAAMPGGPLREAAGDLDRRLREARLRTLVHGDAKPDNFCLGRPGTAAAVDFQYAGGGSGMRDLAYLLDCVLDERLDEGTAAPWLDAYFAALGQALAADPAKTALAAEAETEGRALFPVAWLDFQRFLQGWSPACARPSTRLARQIDRWLGRL